MIMILVGARITDFSIFLAHLSTDGGDFTDFMEMWMHANGALFPLFISYIYVLLYNKNNSKRFYRIFSCLSAIAALCPMLSWVIIPFIYLQGNASINDDVTKFLVVFCEYYNPLIVSLVASYLI